MQDITARATVNRATFYAHFVDKYALVDELIREGFTQILQQRMVTPAHSTEEQVRRLLLAVAICGRGCTRSASIATGCLIHWWRRRSRRSCASRCAAPCLSAAGHARTAIREWSC